MEQRSDAGYERWVFVTGPSHVPRLGKTGECLDHVIVLGEAHLRRILRDYCRYYNEIRTHRSLAKDAPLGRAVQSVGTIGSHAILGGLHHHYIRI
jgi:hypothetical protein